ncbi:hypothetical protein NCCP1664_11900 [Zafaria cholistanensis]|uniref:HTH luxR-type domain-containing protein n=2 Tax=Zafaria cholistanensis TaxID=1682741 RepID=A0A5A7NP55_9MICC|nr:hypothetical protein NCCP1664_11900 [Zafaria cholistanensis]
MAHVVLVDAPADTHAAGASAAGAPPPGGLGDLGRLGGALEPGDLAEGPKAMNAVRGLLARESGGLPVVAYVPDCGRPGPEAVSLLANLALAGVLSLLAVCRGHAPNAPHRLCRVAHLERFRPQPLTPQETAAEIAARCGSDASPEAVAALWEASAGNRRWLAAIAGDWLELGHLVNSSGTWVLAAGPAPVGERARREWRDILDALPPGPRTVVVLVALAGRIPLHALLQVADPADVDHAHESGLLDPGPAPIRTPRLRGTLSARTIASLIPPGRSRELLRLLQEKLGPDAGIPPRELVDWKHAAGAAPDPAEALAAARELLGDGEPRSALAYLDMARDLAGTPAFATVEALGLAAGGRAEEAWETVAFAWGPAPAHGPGEAAAAAVAEWAELGLAGARAQALRGVHGDGPATGECAAVLLARVRETLGKAADAEPGAAGHRRLRGLTAEAELLELELAVGTGRHAEVAALPHDRPDFPPEARLLWQALVAEAEVMCGRVHDGLELGRELMLQPRSPSGRAGVRGNARRHLLNACAVSGDWAEGTDPAGPLRWAGTAPPGAGVPGRRADGLAEVLRTCLAGRGEGLEREIHQLRVNDPCGLLPLALAGSARTLAAQGREVLARERLRELADLEQQPSAWLVRRGTELAATCAEALLGATDPGLRLLLCRAAEDRDAGRTSLELLVLAAAVQMGSTEAVPLLADAAGRADGRFAAACRALAAALAAPGGQRASPDGAGLLAAARTLEALGHGPLAEHAYAEAAAAGVPRSEMGDRGYGLPTPGRRSPGGAAVRTPPGGHASAARPSHVAGMDHRARAGGPPRDPFAGLTGRQRDIAQLVAAGSSNREIADALGLSVRTVESHLYQIYARLGVSRRGELAVPGPTGR